METPDTNSESEGSKLAAHVAFCSILFLQQTDKLAAAVDHITCIHSNSLRHGKELSASVAVVFVAPVAVFASAIVAFVLVIWYFLAKLFS